MSPAPILALIVNYRTAELTAKAIEAILPEIRSRGDSHIVVVDNGSADGSAGLIAKAIERLEAADCCSLLALDDNRGFAAGNNAGLDYYRRRTAETGKDNWPEYTWLLNPDTVAQPRALSALVEFMGAHPKAGLAGGRCLRVDGSIRPSAFHFHTPLSELLEAVDFGPLRRLFRRSDVVIPTGDRPVRAHWLSGSHLLIRGIVFDRIGLLDEGYFLYFEETDFCARAADAGFEAWHVPGSRIVHIGGQATGVSEGRSARRRPRYWFASRARFLIRRHGIAKTHLANALWLLASPLGRVIAGLRRRRRNDPPRFWLDFLFHYYGPGGLMYHPHQLAA